MLVPPGRTTSIWALYEKWSSANALQRPDGTPIATFATSFGVFYPSRYASTGATIARTLPLCGETAADGDRANGVDCASALRNTPFDDPRSPFDGTRRDVYVKGTPVSNDDGAKRWWTDPYGGNASATPFPAASVSSSLRRRTRATTTHPCRSSAATAATTLTASTPRTRRAVSGL